MEQKTNEQLLVDSTLGGLKFTPIEETYIGYNPAQQQAVNLPDNSWSTYLKEIAAMPAKTLGALYAGFTDTAATSLRGAFSFGQKLAQDTSYNPFKDPQLVSQGNEFINKYADWFLDSPNAKFTLDGINRVRALEQDAKAYEGYGLPHLIGQLAGGLADPLTFMTFAGAGSRVYNVSKSIGIASLAAEGGLLGAAFSTAQQEFDPTVTDDDIKTSAIFGAVLGSAIGGLTISQIHGDAIAKYLAVPDDLRGQDLSPSFLDDSVIWGDELTNAQPELPTFAPTIESKTTSVVNEPSVQPQEQVLTTRDPEAIMDEIVALNTKRSQVELNYMRTKAATGQTRGDINPYGKEAGQLLNKLKKLQQEYRDITGINLNG